MVTLEDFRRATDQRRLAPLANFVKVDVQGLSAGALGRLLVALRPNEGGHRQRLAAAGCDLERMGEAYLAALDRAEGINHSLELAGAFPPEEETACSCPWK